jgi:hypothetical protein
VDGASHARLLLRTKATTVQATASVVNEVAVFLRHGLGMQMMAAIDFYHQPHYLLIFLYLCHEFSDYICKGSDKFLETPPLLHLFVKPLTNHGNMKVLPLRVRTDNIVKSVLTLSKTSPKMASKVKLGACRTSAKHACNSLAHIILGNVKPPFLHRPK